MGAARGRGSQDAPTFGDEADHGGDGDDDSGYGGSTHETRTWHDSGDGGGGGGGVITSGGGAGGARHGRYAPSSGDGGGDDSPCNLPDGLPRTGTLRKTRRQRKSGKYRPR